MSVEERLRLKEEQQLLKKKEDEIKAKKQANLDRSQFGDGVCHGHASKHTGTAVPRGGSGSGSGHRVPRSRLQTGHGDPDNSLADPDHKVCTLQ